jgi:glyoxylase-like metal-dependent hydrolase (beta-lactamase superfamily II)
MIQVKWRLFQGGYCTHPERMVNPNGSWKKRIFPALFSLIEHPVHGAILFDTGYASHFFSETKRFPYRLFRYITPVTLDPAEEAVKQIKQAGVKAEEIRTIILSHLHTDHISGLKDFRHATVICSQKEIDVVRRKKGWSALQRGFIPSLLPDHFYENIRLVEDCKVVDISEQYFPFEQGYDLLGDGSLVAVLLPGHAQGQIGLFFQTDQGETIFLAADSCWISLAYQQRIFPHPLASLLTVDKKAYKESLLKVHMLSIHHPEIRIVPSHCLETWEQIQKEQKQMKQEIKSANSSLQHE